MCQALLHGQVLPTPKGNLLPCPWYDPPSSVNKGSDNAAKQSTHKVVSAAKALYALQDLIAQVVAAAARGGIPLLGGDHHHRRAPALQSSGGGGAPEAGGNGGGGAGLAASLPAVTSSAAGFKLLPSVVEPVPTELVRPSAWQAKNTLVRDALREIQNRQGQQQVIEREREKAAAAAMAAAAAATMEGSASEVAEALVVAAATGVILPPPPPSASRAHVAATPGAKPPSGGQALVRSPFRPSPLDRPSKTRRTRDSSFGMDYQRH